MKHVFAVTASRKPSRPPVTREAPRHPSQHPRVTRRISGAQARDSNARTRHCITYARSSPGRREASVTNRRLIYALGRRLRRNLRTGGAAAGTLARPEGVGEGGQAGRGRRAEGVGRPVRKGRGGGGWEGGGRGGVDVWGRARMSGWEGGGRGGVDGQGRARRVGKTIEDEGSG